jgi:hypothetical protein
LFCSYTAVFVEIFCKLLLRHAFKNVALQLLVNELLLEVLFCPYTAVFAEIFCKILLRHTFKNVALQLFVNELLIEVLFEQYWTRRCINSRIKVVVTFVYLTMLQPLKLHCVA